MDELEEESMVDSVKSTFEEISSMIALGKKIGKREIRLIICRLYSDQIHRVIEHLRDLEVNTVSESDAQISAWAGAESDQKHVSDGLIQFYEENVAPLCSSSSRDAINVRTERVISILEELLREGCTRDSDL